MSEFQWYGDRIMSDLERSINRAVRAAGEHLLEEANRTVPLDESPLMQSGVVDVEGTEGTVSYDTPYAVRQHEEVTYRHAPGRRAKWLELTVQEQEGVINRFLTEAVERTLR